MENPIISVIVPIYNAERYLRKCLDSICSQTYQHLEIILVDDGSTDLCGVICDEYAANDQRVIVIHQKNAGLSAARNAGLDIAKGDYIQFVDSDDWIERDTYQIVINVAMQQHADVVCFGFIKEWESGKTQVRAVASSGEIGRAELVGQILRGEGAVRAVAWNKLYAAHLFEGARFPVGHLLEDSILVPRLVHRASSIYVIDKVLYHFIRHEGSISAEFYHVNSYVDKLFMYYSQLQFVQEFYPEHEDYILMSMRKVMILGRVLLKNEPDYAAYMEEYRKYEGQYGNKFKSLKTSNKPLWLYSYCRPMAIMWINWRYRIKR